MQKVIEIQFCENELFILLDFMTSDFIDEDHVFYILWLKEIVYS